MVKSGSKLSMRMVETLNALQKTVSQARLVPVCPQQGHGYNFEMASETKRKPKKPSCALLQLNFLYGPVFQRPCALRQLEPMYAASNCSAAVRARDRSKAALLRWAASRRGPKKLVEGETLATFRCSLLKEVCKDKKQGMRHVRITFKHGLASMAAGGPQRSKAMSKCKS